MRLFITEKPKTARQLVAALGDCRHVKSSNSTKFGGHKQGDGWAVTWLSGHLYRLLEPHDHDAQLKPWRISDLPIAHPDPQWKVDDTPSFPPKEEIEEQVRHIQTLYNQASEVILATDADQEGQVLGQVFLEQSGWDKPVKRLWTDLWEKEGLLQALSNIRDNRQFQGLFEAGLSRVVCDQMIGINFTRLLTLKATHAGYDFTARSGRVRSSALHFVVAHHLKVKAHQARPYFNLRASLSQAGHRFQAKLIIPSSLLEDEEHCFDSAPIRQIQQTLQAEREARVQSVNRSQKSYSPPAPFNQNTLSQHCAHYHSMMPDETEAAAQKLYEQGYISYPRVESQAYEASVLNKVPRIMAMLKGLNDQFASAVAEADLTNPQPVFEDAGVDAHGAIYPSSQAPVLSALTNEQLAVYIALSNRLIAQFYGDYITGSANVILRIGDYQFRAESGTVVQPGWTALIPSEDKMKDPLPPLEQDDLCNIESLEVNERKTKAPARLTVKAFQETLRDCTHLLSEAVKNRMGSSKGQLGTGATQKTYLKELVDQGVVNVVDKKYVVPSRRGIELDRLLPSTLASPDLSSLWELHFKAIRNGQKTRQEFVTAVVNWVAAEVERIKGLDFPKSPTINPCRRCESAMTRRERRTDKNSFYWQCTNENCRTTTPDKGGKPVELHPKDGDPCPKCEYPLRTRLRRKDRGRFLGCSNRECKHYEE